MVFDGFPDGEDLERRGGIFALGGNTNTERNRIGAQGEAADGVDIFVQFRGGFLHELPADLADEAGAAWVERCHTRVDVKVALRAGSEGKFAMADGFFLEK